MEIYGLNFLYDWLDKNTYILFYLGMSSILIFFLSIFGIKYFASAIPADYFINKKRFSRLREHSVVLWLIYKIIKNLLGYIFILIGIVALILPGQGVLMILIGLIMSDYPGKFNLEKKIISTSTIRKGVNWLRRKSGVEDLRL